MSQSFISAVFQGPKDIVMAQRIVKVSVYVSILMIFISATLAIAGFFQTSSDARVQYMLDPWMLIDVFLLGVLTFFLYKRKLWAAIVFLIYHLVNLIIIYIELERFPGALGFLKLILFMAAVRSVYMVNKDSKEEKADNPLNEESA
ncbi:hypothetical protein [Photobacterium halotolerans]|uniref:hypothetical protein n=1 Tax=Photobacterium halotolerans TaxID=265726 RepID=UPI000482AFAF|nr:hypothetical protein [Photobacterium halotolerans]